MRNAILPAALGMAFGAAMLAAPAQAAAMPQAGFSGAEFTTMTMQDYDQDDDRWEHSRRHRHGHDRDYGRGYRDGYYRDDDRGERLYRDTRVWRGDNGRYYCRKRNGTTGLIIGGAAGALLGREVDQYGDRALGTILGAAGGALIGREIDRGGSRCR